MLEIYIICIKKVKSCDAVFFSNCILFFHTTFCILQKYHNLVFNKIIFFSLKLLQSLFILSHYIASFLLLFFINHNIMHCEDISKMMIVLLFSTWKEL